MEDLVPFKVYAHWSEDAKPEVRRFGVERSVVTSFHYLNAKLQDVYPGLRNKSYTVAWKDEDGDDVVISSDDEVMVALSQMNGGDVIKLYVYCANFETEDKEPVCEVSFTPLLNSSGVEEKPHHYGVVCDGCDGPVMGYRYKCASCDDFDLCATCEAAGVHPGHCMVRIPMPTMPHALIKAAIKRSRHFLKTVAVKEDCPYKKHRRDRSGDKRQRDAEKKQQRETEGHHRQAEGHHRQGRRECRRPRGSWLETFATYMNEFADLAGDMTNTEAKKPEPTTSAEQPATSEHAQSNNGENTCGGGTNTQEKEAPQRPRCPIQLDKIINAENVKCLMELQKQLAEMLVPNLLPEPQGFASASASASTSASASASTSTTTSSTTTASGTTTTTVDGPHVTTTTTVTVPVELGTDVEMGQGDRKSPESDRSSVKSASSSSSADSKLTDPSADKADDWTMINKENDLVDMASAKMPAPLQPTAPQMIEKPIGFDLPQEFQERVRLSERQSLYPPLNLATAQLNPNEPQPPAAAPTAPQQPQPQPQPQSQPQSQSQTQSQSQPQPRPQQPQPTPAQPQPRHPKAHIAAAIDHMVAMGFNNDGGWLTQLLDNYDGNISAVLDLLTPIAPKKK